MEHHQTYTRSIVCGALAGLAVDLSLYPLDTIKTRMQSAEGFAASGGLRHLYRGMSSVALGSAPSAALFFSAYNTLKQLFVDESVPVHAFSATTAETIACLVRVPTELIKQRAQAHSTHQLSKICGEIFRNHGFFGFYRGYFSTVLRDVPFAFIEFPIWEALKREVARRSHKEQCPSFASAICGSFAGAVAAMLSTPLDVAKTRIMLSKKAEASGLLETVAGTWLDGGIKRLFSGAIPRSTYMAIGGFVFFGTYQQVDSIWQYVAKLK